MPAKTLLKSRFHDSQQPRPAAAVERAFLPNLQLRQLRSTSLQAGTCPREALVDDLVSPLSAARVSLQRLKAHTCTEHPRVRRGTRSMTCQDDRTAQTLALTPDSPRFPGPRHRYCAALAIITGRNHLHLGSPLLPGRLPNK